MKIISKYKDYYDYLAGIYGIDEKLVLDRTNFGIPIYTDVVSFYICGKRIDGYFDSKENKFYFGEDLKVKFPEKTQRHSRWYYRLTSFKDFDKEVNYMFIPVEGIRNGKQVYINIIDDKYKLNEKFSCPILCDTKGTPFGDATAYTMFPKLDETGIVKMLPPHDIYMMLCEWLGKEKEITDNRTNEEKILSAGFDKKISFRNVK